MLSSLEDVKVVKISDPVAAGTTAVTSDAIDMAGYEGAIVLGAFGTAAANNVCKLQQSSDNGVADDYSDLEGSLTAPGASDEDFAISVVRPTKRYLKAVAARGTSTTLENMWAILFGPKAKPVTNAISGTITTKTLVSPEEGTA